MKIKKSYFVICILFSIMLTISIGTTQFIEYKPTEITIIGTTEKNILSQGNKIVINNILVDNNKIKINKNEDNTDGWKILDEYGGEFEYKDEINDENSLKIKLPSGKNRKIVFNVDKWSGIVKIRFDNNKIVSKDLYSFSNSGDSIDINVKGQIEMINYKAYIVCFIICFIVLYLLRIIIEKIFKNYKPSKIVRKEKLFRQVILISGIILSDVLSIYSNSIIYLIFTTYIAMIIYNILLNKYCILKKYDFTKISYSISSTLLSIYWFACIVQNRYSYMKNYVMYDYIVCILLLCILPALYIINYILIYEFCKTIKKLYFSSDKSEKIYFLIFTTIVSIVIFVLYSKTSGFSYGYYINSNGDVERQWADIVYDFDHSWILDSYTHLCEHFYNIRHPLFRFFSIPMSGIAQLISSLFKEIYPLAYPAVLSIENALLLGISAILLKRLINDTVVMYLFSSTYMFLILSLGSEQYQISIFLILFTIYSCLNGRIEIYKFSGIMLSGSTLTSGFLVPILNMEKDIRKYIFNLLKYCFVFIISLFTFGVGYIIFNIQELFSLLNEFGGGGYTLFEKIKVYTHFVRWCFIAPKSKIFLSSTGNSIYSGDYPEHISIFGCSVLILCIVSFIINRKEKYTQICFYTVLFSIILSVVIGWGMYSEWLYAILFSWAYISLLCILLRNLIRSEKLYNILIIGLTLVFLWYNINELGKLITFCIEYYGVVIGG
ncbi:hypothetical protein [Clostridium sp.]|uniref:hypothetical protein n=1 Tax=Clostridium sp. TaxID=1506 RepID=UPI00290A3EB5|nr:hypothetical protein [Clostridium sp.]MDU4480104.1 hypothetical protein [Clostridium sp.]